MTEVRIKIEDEGLLELAREMSGIQVALDSLAFSLGEKSKRFWGAMQAKYKEEIPPLTNYTQSTRFDNNTNELVIRNYGEK